MYCSHAEPENPARPKDHSKARNPGRSSFDFQQSKLDELKALALAAGADKHEVKRILERQYGSVS